MHCAVATKHFYSTITLRPHSAASYECRISTLKTILSSRPALGSFVRRLRFSHEHQDITRKHWASIVAHSPGLTVLQGVATLFPEDIGNFTLGRNIGALCGLPALSQAVIYHEVMPCAPPTFQRPHNSKSHKKNTNKIQTYPCTTKINFQLQ
ncbi:hypothetical protein EX30DRAFT_50336 [Ascodesmis nigricans]|uniref:Uncharacterized protein n=1 Tax=Ascodesmis nigricans TaxID=341454 RepID=A0A4S2MW58_9PEZI|nr:hypothetical protein EX30DRAFT_50336 [Ascodesmis nigricans]